jgi:hypothetical protein
MFRSSGSLLVLAMLPALAGCDSVSRFGSSLDPRSSSSFSSGGPPPISATPTPQVSSEPLPPPPSRFATPPQGGTGSIVQGGSPEPAGTLPGGVSAPAAGDLTPAPGKVALSGPTKRPEGAAPAAVEPVPEKPMQSRLTGGWSVAQGSGSNCRLTLSNAPALDLYKAQTSGCGTGLGRVSAWELRGDEIYLYEQGGGVAARLKQSGSLKFTGVASKSGAPVTISK